MAAQALNAAVELNRNGGENFKVFHRHRSNSHNGHDRKYSHLTSYR